MLPFRSGRRTADPRAKMVGAEGLEDEARQAKWAPKGRSRRRAQARGHSAPHVDGRDVQLAAHGAGARDRLDHHHLLRGHRIGGLLVLARVAGPAIERNPPFERPAVVTTAPAPSVPSAPLSGSGG
jgi:hypothetical protein